MTRKIATVLLAAALTAACSRPTQPTPPPVPQAPPVVVTPPADPPAEPTPPPAPPPVPTPPVPPAPGPDEDDEPPRPPAPPVPTPPVPPAIPTEVWTITVTDASPGFPLSGTVELRISDGWRAKVEHLKGGVIFRSPTVLRVDLFANGGAHVAELVLVQRDDGSWHAVFNGPAGMAHGTARR
jgi:hypothetical protein